MCMQLCMVQCHAAAALPLLLQVYKFCPGVDYIVTVRFPEPRTLKLAAAQGIWDALTGIWCVAGLRSTAAVQGPL